jgi:hypothetical protein
VKTATKKRRLIALVRSGKTVTEARTQVGVSRTTAWRWLKGAKAEADPEPEPAATLAPAPRLDPDDRRDLEQVLPLDVIAALDAPDEPEPSGHVVIPGDDGLPHVVLHAGDPEQPSKGFGQRAIPPGDPALSRKSYVPGRDRSFAVGMNPSEADLGPDPDIASRTQRPDAPEVGPRRPVRPIDPRESYAGVLRRRRERGTQASRQSSLHPW